MKRGNTAVPMYTSKYEPMWDSLLLYCRCWTVCLLHCEGAFEIRKNKCGLESSRFFAGGHTNVHTACTHRGTVRGCHKGTTLKCSCCGYHDLYLLGSEHDLIHRYTAAAYSTCRKNGIDCTALWYVRTVVPGAVVPTAWKRKHGRGRRPHVPKLPQVQL